MSQNANARHEESLSLADRSALFIVDKAGTILFFLLCNLLCLSVLLEPDWTAWVQFISSGWLQLVLLPLMLIASNLQSRHAEKRADALYEATLKIDRSLEKMEKEEAARARAGQGRERPKEAFSA
jgi:Zn-dependent protease with chaperone function